MKKTLHSFTLLLIACCLLGGLQSAYASHIQGGQITYRYVTGDTYEVTVSFYRDCSPGAAQCRAMWTSRRSALVTAVALR